MSPSQSSANSNVSAALTKSMHDHWGLYLGEGIVLILLGLAAIIFPFIAGIVATVFLGWLFLIAGSWASSPHSEGDRLRDLDGRCFRRWWP